MMKKRILMITALISVAASTDAFAQCATGVDTGGGNCVPPEALPGAQANTAPQGPPPPAWLGKFGAVVIDSKTSALGVADNMDSQRAAFSKAVAQCQAFGGKDCDYRLPYANQCVALSWGNGGYGIARNDDEQEAENQATASCKAEGDGCRTVYRACSKAIRLR
ncbi:DUF4189 domain-containing protein [Bacillus sp. NP157]|nr:DUF4189 domain-containing protein [Bacillus sp. NP157]